MKAKTLSIGVLPAGAVTATTDPVTGGSVISGPDGDPLRMSYRNSRTLKKGPWGRTKTIADATDRTDVYQIELESDYVAVRLWLPNAHTAEVSGLRANAYPQSAAGSATGNLAAVLDAAGGTAQMASFTFAGSVTATLPARVAAERPSWTPSDWLYLKSAPRTDDGERPLLGLRIEKPAALADATTTYTSVSGWDSPTVQNDQRILRKYRIAGLGVQNKSIFGSTPPSSTATSNFWPFVVEYALAAASGEQWFGGGDSTVEGYGSTARLYPHWARACIRASTPEAPKDYVNFGLHAQMQSTYAPYFTENLEWVKPDVIVYSPYTINAITPGVTIGYADVRVMYGNLGRVLGEIPKQACAIMLSGLPCNPGFKAYYGDSERLSFNANLPNVPGTRVVSVDISTVVSDGADPTTGQTLFASGMSADNVHLSEVAQELTYAQISAAYVAVSQCI